MNPALFALLIDIFGVIAGLFSLFIIFNIAKRIGGAVEDAFTLVLWGIFFQTSALIYSVVLRLKLFPPLPVDLHHAIMVVGMLFFFVAAKKISDISR